MSTSEIVTDKVVPAIIAWITAIAGITLYLSSSPEEATVALYFFAIPGLIALPCALWFTVQSILSFRRRASEQERLV